MTELRYLAPSTPGDPVAEVIAAISAVIAINGHHPDDEELAALLRDHGAITDVDQVRAGLDTAAAPARAS